MCFIITSRILRKNKSKRQKPTNAKYNYENNEILEKNILGQTDFYKKLTYP